MVGKSKKNPVLEWLETEPFSSLKDPPALFGALYRSLKNHDPTFSYRKMAELLGFSASNYFHLVIKGKRPFTSRAAETIVKHLKLPTPQREMFRMLAAFEAADSTEQRSKLYMELEDMAPSKGHTRILKRQFRYYSKWYHTAIRELISSPFFEDDPVWLASMLTPKITVQEAKQAMKTLADLGLIRRNRDSKRWEVVDKAISTDSLVRSMYVKSFHRAMILAGADALDKFKASEREISSLTLGIDAKTAAAIKQKIRDFQASIVQLVAQAGDGTTVFQLNIQCFPITKDSTPSSAPMELNEEKANK